MAVLSDSKRLDSPIINEEKLFALFDSPAIIVEAFKLLLFAPNY
jgi:hypothetical protein